MFCAKHKRIIESFIIYMVIAVNRESQDAKARPLYVSEEALEELRWFGDRRMMALNPWRNTENIKYPQ